nr:hypothetical protein [uncultured Agathobaculum sp.]
MMDRVERIMAMYRMAGQQSPGGGASFGMAAGAGGAPQDTLTLQGNWQQTNWTVAVNQVLQSLQDSFPDVEIVLGSAPDEDALRQMAATLGGGKHLVLDPSFLAQMAQGPEAFEQGCETLMRLLRTLHATDISGVYVTADKAQTWQYFEKSPHYEELERAQRLLRWFHELNQPKEEKQPLIVTPPQFYSTKGKYNRLARAQSVGQVNLLVSDINSTIDSLQGEAMGSGENAAKARRAIRSLRALLVRASRKISRLQAEQLLSAKKKRAEREQKQEEARRLRQQQKDQRTKRRRADAQTATGGIVQTPTQSKRWKNNAYDEFAAVAAPACPLPTVSVGEGGGAAEGGTVVFGPEITF